MQHGALLALERVAGAGTLGTGADMAQIVAGAALGVSESEPALALNQRWQDPLLMLSMRSIANVRICLYSSTNANRYSPPRKYINR